MNTKMTDKQDDLEDELQAILNLSEKLIMQQKIDVDKNWRLLHSRIHKTNQRQMFFKWIRNIAAILLFPLPITVLSLILLLSTVIVPMPLFIFNS